ncbi:class I SAM-dependent methyltransferase [Patescibacteria group bacterium]|nr:class I SAM-dependent methyltransferase [Patescibacteria group bacterium]
MQESEIIQMQKAESDYWWHVSRRFIFQSILRRFLKREDNKILDVGCGTGSNMVWLKSFGEVIGIDTNQTALDFAKQYGEVIKDDASDLSVQSGAYNLLTAFDVLEHISDDETAIREWHRVLTSDGHLFISVPAYQWLFSNRDKQLGHYRRYNLRSLLKLLRQSGFKIVFSSYIFILVFPLLVLQRIFLQKSSSSIYPQLPQFLNNFLERLSNLEAGCLQFIRFPFGGSIVILAKKL